MRKVLIVTLSWDDPPYPTSQKNYQVDSKIKVIVLHDKGEGYQQPTTCTYNLVLNGA